MKRLAFALCAVLTAGIASAENHYVPNRIKYSDTGHQPATGRSGGAAVEALALLDRQGIAEVEIRAAAPGTLRHVQVKTAQQTDNYNANAAAFTATLEDAGRGTAVSVLANVHDAAGGRVGVVEVHETVVLRPDLVPSQLAAPATATLGVPVEISARVTERNGDIGARATCALRVDGATVSRATNIWVDAGGNVSCSFVHAFATAGDRQLEVVVEDVLPRDYDPANNSVSGSIRVSAERQIEPTGWSMFAGEQESWMESRAWSVWGHTSETRGTNWSSSAQIGVAMFDTVLNMETMQLRYSEVTEGQTIVAFDPVPLVLSPLAAYRQCGRMLRPDDSLEILVCQLHRNDDWYDGSPYDIASISIRRDSSDATYYAHEAAPAIDGAPAYDREVYYANTSGEQVRYGNSVAFDIHLTDGSQTLHLDRTLTLERTEYPLTESLSCWGSWCQEMRYAGWTKFGQAFE